MSVDPPELPDPIPADGEAWSVEYIKAMLEYARDDARQVYLRVTAAFATAALLLTQVPFRQLQSLALAPKIAFIAGLGSLVIAAVLHHSYLQDIHHTRVQIAQCLPTVDAATAKRLGPETWNKELWRLHVGDGLLALAAALLATVVVVLLV